MYLKYKEGALFLFYDFIKLTGSIALWINDLESFWNFIFTEEVDPIGFHVFSIHIQEFYKIDRWYGEYII